MRSFFLVFCCSFFAAAGSAQTKTYPQLVLKAAPTALFDVATPTVMPGAELRFLKHWGMAAEYGLQCDLFEAVNNENKQGHRYRKMRLEARYYFEPVIGGDSFLPFVAVQGYWMQQQYRRANSHYRHLKTGEFFRYDTSFITRRSDNYSIQAGMVQHFGRRRQFLFEVALGFGIKSVLVRNTRLVNARLDTPFIFDEVRLGISDRFEGRRYGIHLPFALRMGYLFGRMHP